MILLQRLAASHLRGSATTRRRKLSDADAFDGATFDHSLWDAVLAAHVNSRRSIQGVTTATISYDGVANDDRFAAYLRALATVDLLALAPAEQLALLINAYNALCVSVIIEHERRHPEQRLSSITQLSSGSRKVWDQPAGTLGGHTVSLGEVEHAKLRGQFDEPALHFCIVCASASCPDLRSGAYTAASLRQQMDEQASAFFRDHTKGLAWDGRTLTLSRILYWFGDDWGGPRQAADAALDALRDEEATLAHAARDELRLRSSWERYWGTRYFEYCWALNRA